jgi:hypothetical protein
MGKVTEHRVKGLRGMRMFKVGVDVYLACDTCCRAWYRGRHPGSKWPALSKQDRYNMQVHIDRHAQVTAADQGAEQ